MSTERSILIVDDFEATRAITKFTLQRVGYKVYEAADGQEALSLLGKSPIDLIITDLSMPNMDGLALTSALRTTSNYRYTPVLMLSTTSRELHKDDPRMSNLTGWITKPYTVTNFLSTVQKAIR